ncbi:MAG: hypothetical protein AB7I27_17625 [Bacteriovoracaceae bacterium]
MKFVILLMSLILFTSCSSRREKELDKTIAEAPVASSHEEVNKRVYAIIENSPKLTSEQKKELLALHMETHKQMLTLNQESIKIHELLATEFGKSKEDKKLINALQKRMVKNSKKRLNILFDSMRQSNVILGREQAIDRTQMINDLYFEHMTR